MRILFLSRWFPDPPDNGSKLRILNILKQLSKCHEIDLISFYEGAAAPDPEKTLELGEYCARIQTVRYRGFHPSSASAVFGFFSSRPRSIVDTYSSDMVAVIADAGRNAHYDLVMASQLDMAEYVHLLPDTPAVLEELEVGLFIDAMVHGCSPLARLRARLTWLKLSAYLRRTLPTFAACTVVSELERAYVRQAAPMYRDVETIPNAIDLARHEGEFGSPCRNSVIFCGSLSYFANHDAARFLLAEIYPAIANELSGCTLRITGSTAGVDLASLPPQSGVEFTDQVADVRPLIAQSWASLVPLRLGGGTRLKILESMALGTPVVSTSKGAEGLDVTDGENILLADEPTQFADQTVRLLRSPELRQRLSVGGLQLVRSHYEWGALGTNLRAVAERAATAKGFVKVLA
jgi:glycosyltransferase involved in cell wall biosynthesis